MLRVYVNSPHMSERAGERPGERANIHTGVGVMRGRMARPRFEAESSVKLFGAFSARATNGPARRFKESRESQATYKYAG